jgi:hypothetical protein
VRHQNVFGILTSWFGILSYGDWVSSEPIVIPARTPHWFNEAPQSISYHVIRVLKQKAATPAMF